jgi:hypothetical protein
VYRRRFCPPDDTEGNGLMRVARYPYKRSHLAALRTTKISASDPPSTAYQAEKLD